MARSPQSRLFDNIGRRIRHLKEDLRNPDIDDIRQVGLERQIENLENYRKALRKEASKNPNNKLTNEQIYEATDRMKTDDNLSTKKKIIDEISIKMVIAEDFDELTEKDIKELRTNPEIVDLMARYTRLTGLYIGQSGQIEGRSNANMILENAKAINQYELTPNQINFLNKMIESINYALNSKGKNGVLYPIGKNE